MPAKRSYGMDQGFYPWSPIVTRPVLRWPDNARVALAVIVNLEHWDWEVPAGTALALDKMVAENYPFLIEEGRKRRAEFIGHGLSRRQIIHVGMGRDEERQY